MPMDMNSMAFTVGSLLDPEEERRRRLEQERQAMLAAPVAPVKPTPVKETITTDPVTGERKVKIEGTERDLSAMNTRTPTVTLPGAAAPVAPDQFRFANLAPEQITAIEQAMAREGINDRGILRGPGAQQLFDQRPLADRQRLFQVAAPSGMQQTSAVAPVAPGALPAPPAPATTAGATPVSQNYDSLLAGSQVNPRVRSRMMNDPSVPLMYRAAARSNEESAVRQEQDNRRLNAQIAKIGSGDPEAWDRAIREEGSLLKAIVFGYSGAQDLARNELNKLGYGGKWESTTDENGNRAIIKYRQDGIPMEGFDESGTKLTSAQLAAFGAEGGTGKWTTSGTFFQTPDGQILRAQSNERGRSRYVDASTGAVYRGPTNNLMKLEEAGQYRKMDYGLVTDLKKKHGANVLEAEKEFVALNGPFRTDSERQAFRDAYGFSQAMPPTPTPSTQMAPPAGGAAAPVAPTQAPAAAPAAQPMSQQTAPVGGPVAPGQAPALSATAPQLNPVVSRGNVNVPLEEQRRRAAGAKIETEEGAKDVAEYRAKKGRVEDNADYLITKVEELVEHPGMSTSVGAKGPSYLFGLKTEPLPPQLGGGDARDFMNRLGEIEGQAFLQAYEVLRGGGQISNVEGERATRAIVRMKTAATEKEFKSAAQDFIGIIKRGVDRGRKKLGEEPVYGEAPASQQRRRGEPGTASNPIRLD